MSNTENKKSEQINEVIRDFVEGGYMVEYPDLENVFEMLKEYRDLIAKNEQNKTKVD